MKTSRPLLVLAMLGLTIVGLLEIGRAQAQFSALRPHGGAAPVNRSDPVGFTADTVDYDRNTGIVTATGNVQAWQNDHVLRADKITFDRNRDVAAASGHVWIVEPDGQVLFSDYAELTQGMRDGVLKGMEALLAQNGKLIANGARRVEGKVNELSRAIYTTCDLCKKDPSHAPLWELRARDAVQDIEHKRIEYQDVVLDVYGVPVGWLPYFWTADPSVKRESGFLVPSFGHAKQLGEFVRIPYYWVLDNQSDVTFLPTLNTSQYFNLDSIYRRRFNDGTLRADIGFGYDQNKLQGAIFAKGTFAYDDTWRWGFNLNRASSATYLRDYRFTDHADVLASNVYVEGFGVGSYSRLDMLAYQGLVTSISQERLPYALPRYIYSYFGEPDSLGGRLTAETQDFNVLREQGTNTQRLATTVHWDRPFDGALGEQYKLTLRTDAGAYNATSLNDNPNYSNDNNSQTVRAQPTAALEVRWPFVRDGWGRQIIEPIVQAVASPYSGHFFKQNVPNEDSLDFEFTDANLFQINKFPGQDREEGGLRVNAGVHANWKAGTFSVDQLVGQSYRSHADDSFPIASGLEHSISDVVTRTSVSPGSWLDLTGRTRLDRRDLSLRFADLSGTTGVSNYRLGVGYLYSDTNPYLLYDQSTIPASYFRPRNEVTLNGTANYDHLRFSAFARRDLHLNKMVSAGVRATWENECLILDANVSRRYTSLNGDTGATIVLFQVTFKTVGQFGFNAF